MCGIVGAVSRTAVDEALLVRMRDRLAHRGPDSAGTWAAREGRVRLGHRRLAILDLSAAANQPFVSRDGKVALVLNGEIYNFRELREELERDGIAFRTRSDTEVLLELYRRDGVEMLDSLSGMFAFAIWDEARGRLLCARDRVGEKPFYYAELGDAFVFGSELKALLPWPGFRREVDQTAVADFLTFGFVPDPKTIWACARKLPPGHVLEVVLEDGRPRVGAPKPYWDLQFDPDPSSRDWEGEIREALERSADEMSFADVPVGTLLSGGVDSSSVAAALVRTGRNPRTYTIGFADSDYDERPWARRVSEHCGTTHFDRLVEPEDVGAVFRDTVLWHYDEPFNDYSYLPTYFLSREARRDITVALSGDGGDELFAGYGKYRLLARRNSVDRTLGRPLTQLVATGARSVAPTAVSARLLRYKQSAPTLLTSLMTTGLQPGELRTAARGELARTLAEYDPEDVVRGHLDRARPEEVGLVNAMRYVDLKLTLASGILVKVDRASMAVALEVRPVLLNRRMVELAARIPPALLADGRDAKKMLKAAVRDWLPADVLNRPKQGFAMPLGRWLRQGAVQLVAGEKARAELGELIDPAYVEGATREHVEGIRDRTAILHSFVFLEHWLERWT